MSRGRRAEMITPDHPGLSIVRQCELVNIGRSSHYYTGKGESAFNLQLMRLTSISTPDVLLTTEGA